MKDKETKENKGVAFVTLTAKDVAQRAIEELHDKDHKVMCGFSLQDITGVVAFVIYDDA
jgi:RNA recognition motif-containing protein